MKRPARKALLEALTHGQLQLLDAFLAEREREQLEELVATTDVVQTQGRVKEVREIRELLKKRSAQAEEGSGD